MILKLYVLFSIYSVEGHVLTSALWLIHLVMECIKRCIVLPQGRGSFRSLDFCTFTTLRISLHAFTDNDEDNIHHSTSACVSWPCSAKLELEEATYNWYCYPSEWSSCSKVTLPISCWRPVSSSSIQASCSSSCKTFMRLDGHNPDDSQIIWLFLYTVNSAYYSLQNMT